MDELFPNPDGCAKFEPNQFKKEKCKHCGQLWSSHKGVISQELVLNYQQAKLKIAEDKQKKEAEARAAAQAKTNAKKKANQAVEDDWLFDGPKDDTSKIMADGDSDDDLGFRMFSAAELASAAPSSSDPDSRQLKVVNLIDWGECDIPEELDAIDGTAPSIKAAYCPAVGSCQVSEAKVPVTATAFDATQFDTDYFVEIQHLRERLADAEEEKKIQLDIVHDEVREQQNQIAELRQRLGEAQKQMEESESRQRLADAVRETTDQADILRDEVREKHAENTELTRQNADLGAKLREAQECIEDLKARERLARADEEKEKEENMKWGNLSWEKQQQIEDLTQQTADLGAQLRESQKKIEDLETQHKLVEAGEAQTAEVVSAHDEVTERQAQIAEITRQTTRLESQLEETQNPGTDLEQSLISVKEEAKSHQRNCCEIEQVCTTVSDAEAKREVGVLPGAVAVLKEREASASALQAERLGEGARWASSRKEKAAHAQAVRDIRIYAEQQLAWVLQRVSVNPQLDLEKISTVAKGY